MIVYIQQIRVAGWIRVVLSWLLLYMGKGGLFIYTSKPLLLQYTHKGLTTDVRHALFVWIASLDGVKPFH